jgi:uncharacterized membrane protein
VSTATTTPAPSTHPAGTGPPAPDTSSPHGPSVTGGVLGLAFAAMSVTPSLVPRGWLIQAVLVGVCAVTGYGLGAFLGWAYRSLELPDLPPGVRRVVWRVLAVVALVGLPVAGWLGRGYQAEQRELLGMDPSVPWLWMLAPWLGLVVAALLLGIGRSTKWLARTLARPLVRVVPRRVGWLLAVLATVAVAWFLLSGVLVGNAVSIADSFFEEGNRDDKPGVVNPESPHRSGGPDSGVSWESIGREGRAFVWEGLTASDIASVVGDEDAVEPVRAYVGLAAADTPEERAQLAVEELRRLGGFDRRAIAVAGATGSGWVDPKAANALEYATHGDVATVSMQYSYLPSWLSFLIDQSRAQANAETLITALRVELDGLPADSRPELYVFGESLGAFSTGSAFTSVEDMSTTTDGALLIGPPSFDETWQKVVEGRTPGSPVWRPNYGDGALVRAAATDRDLTDQTLTWRTDNPIIYLVHPSDPIVAWTADHAAWLDPRGPDVSERVVAWPVVGGWQATFDQFNANGVPSGHGHVYDETVVTAWSEIVGPPSLPASEIEAIRAAIAGLEQ